MLTTINFVCGKDDGPIPDSTVFKNDKLKRVFVEYIIVDNVNENCIRPNRDFSHDYVDGELDRGQNKWVLGNKLTIVYSSCNC